MKSEKERNQTPFKEEFKTFGVGGFTNVHTFENDPRWVVKEVRKGNYGDNIKEATESLEPSKVFLHRFIPQTHLVVGKNKLGKDTLFMVQEKVTGEGLDEIILRIPGKKRDEKMEGHQEEIDELYADVVRVYLETYNPEENGGLSADVKMDNLMVGRRQSDLEDHVYLVDIFPAIRFDAEVFERYIKEKAETLTGYYPMEMPKFQVALSELEAFVKEKENE